MYVRHHNSYRVQVPNILYSKSISQEQGVSWATGNLKEGGGNGVSLLIETVYKAQVSGGCCKKHSPIADA